MSGKHTPGPWKKRKGFQDGTVEIFKPNKALKKPFYPTEIAVVEADSREGKANARLMAAAPTMLAALIVAREFISTDRNSLADCSTPPHGEMDPDDAAAIADYDAALRQIDAAIQQATGPAA